MDKRDGSSQGVIDDVITKPFISRNGNNLYNPETYLNSQLSMYNKRTPIQPSNFIGIKRLRNDNIESNRQHSPYMNHINNFPILRTPEIPIIYQ